MEDLPFEQNCDFGFRVCSEGPAIGQNTHDDKNNDNDDIQGVKNKRRIC